MYSKFTVDTVANSVIIIKVYAENIAGEIHCYIDQVEIKQFRYSYIDDHFDLVISFHKSKQHIIEIIGIYTNIKFNSVYGIRSCFIDKLDEDLETCKEMFRDFPRVYFNHDVLPKNVKILDAMFYCAGLTKNVVIDIPDSVISWHGIFNSTKYVEKITLNCNKFPSQGTYVFPDKKVSISSDTAIPTKTLKGLIVDKINFKILKENEKINEFIPSFNCIRTL